MTIPHDPHVSANPMWAGDWGYWLTNLTQIHHTYVSMFHAQITIFHHFSCLALS